MAKIFFSVSGEGRGHAARARTIVEALRDRHDFTLFSYGMAYDFLADAYRGASDVEVRRIPGMEFRYRGQRLDYLKSLGMAIPFLCRLRSRCAALAAMMRREKPDLVLTDFEPLLPRAANRCGVPYVSLDHQHFLVVNDLSSLPLALRWRAWAIGLFVPMFYRNQKRTIVSSFYSPPLKRGYRHAVQAGVLLREEILRARPTVGEHLLVYLRRFGRGNLLDALERHGLPARVYGLGARPSRGAVEFREIDERSFLRDLATCKALISNAGNQLVGEALYLKKPVLALPETGNFEQAVNAHFLRETGCGDWREYDRFDESDLATFLSRVEEFRERIAPERYAGNDAALAALEACLPETAFELVKQAA